MLEFFLQSLAQNPTGPDNKTIHHNIKSRNWCILAELMSIRSSSQWLGFFPQALKDWFVLLKLPIQIKKKLQGLNLCS